MDTMSEEFVTFTTAKSRPSAAQDRNSHVLKSSKHALYLTTVPFKTSSHALR